ncbi:MAG TPA: hypothetical protein DCM40_21935 [Maribacter sp.]|jgi:hypothetical protein|nr:hypothetical protein [Maribacter sp.]|tara:strand:+ start:1222 stop:1461 length:240 start_codon:yes stop_codon:yes gene_type:complete
MDKEVQESYDKMFDTLSTEGWGIIKQRLLEMFAQQNNLLNIQDEKTFWQQRGALGMLHLMIEFENVLKNEVEQAEQNAE